MDADRFYLFDKKKRYAVEADREVAGWYFSNWRKSKKFLVRCRADKLDVFLMGDLDWVSLHDQFRFGDSAEIISSAIAACRNGVPF